MAKSVSCWLGALTLLGMCVMFFPPDGKIVGCLMQSRHHVSHSFLLNQTEFPRRWGRSRLIRLVRPNLELAIRSSPFPIYTLLYLVDWGFYEVSIYGPQVGFSVAQRKPGTRTNERSYQATDIPREGGGRSGGHSTPSWSRRVWKELKIFLWWWWGRISSSLSSSGSAFHEYSYRLSRVRYARDE
ncbi:hypothetical protein B0H66DRAFT_564317 [Apodospora peruviana]|uniref:Uncharacterized protein n=1 Tax=Apodospora peruviana TaxID=516989 RepID=A0AAE0M120_9PEZI|nr:hypothetical protein B0H66DRAFT_564317 [Apodospora peruviana]